MKIAMAGCGYVGLVTGACLANLGNDVICADVDDERISNLRSGIMPFFEPGLRELVELNVTQKRLMFTTDLQLAIENSDLIFIAVGTPSDGEGKADLSGVFNVADAIASFINGYKVVVMKSTVPVGTSKKLVEYMGQKAKAEFDVVSNPEFLREGEAIKDFTVPDRIIIGTRSDKARDVMNSIYKSIERTGRPIVFTTPETAELIKYCSNAMLASRISFMNEISYLCEKTGTDVKMVARGVGLDKRIGPRFLQAGVGYGGSCFGKDVRVLARLMKENGCSAQMLEAIDAVNEKQRLSVIAKLREFVPDLNGKKIAVWGLSFKPKTDDIREAPSLAIIAELQKLGASVTAFDPVSVQAAGKVLKGVTFTDTPLTALDGAHAVIVVTEWDLFRELDKEKMKSLMASPNVIDGRNMYDPSDFRSLGFNYAGIGRG